MGIPTVLLLVAFESRGHGLDGTGSSLFKRKDTQNLRTTLQVKHGIAAPGFQLLGGAPGNVDVITYQ